VGERQAQPARVHDCVQTAEENLQIVCTQLDRTCRSCAGSWTEPADRVYTAETEPADRVYTAETEPADRVYTAETEPADRVQTAEQNLQIVCRQLNGTYRSRADS
jgi:hypothetical protein